MDRPGTRERNSGTVWNSDSQRTDDEGGERRRRRRRPRRRRQRPSIQTSTRQLVFSLTLFVCSFMPPGLFPSLTRSWDDGESGRSGVPGEQPDERKINEGEMGCFSPLFRRISLSVTERTMRREQGGREREREKRNHPEWREKFFTLPTLDPPRLSSRFT